MYFLTYEFIKKKVTDSEPKDQPASKTRAMAGTIFAGGMGENRLMIQLSIAFVTH
jgi:hypothetical protein